MLEKTNTTFNSIPAETEDIKTKSAQIGVLLIHGLTGTPVEMKPLAKYLKRLGYRVETPMLPGHGTGHEDLLATTWQDWLNGVRQTLNTLSAECESVSIVGLSVGGLLGTLLAAENPSVSSLVLLSFALGITGSNIPKIQCLLPLVFKFPFLRRFIFWKEEPPYGLKDKRLQQNITRTIEASKRGETSQYGLFRTYVESLYQHKLLEEEVRSKASQVTCPTFIMHSLEDTMLSTVNATKIYNLLGSKEKSISFITGCDHIMTVDLRKYEVAHHVGEFISKITGGSVKELEPIGTNKTREHDLNCEVHPRLNPLSNADWIKLFQGLPDSPEMINLIQRSGFNGFKFHSIVVQDGNNPILLLPLFETNYNISSMLDKSAQKTFDSIASWIPKLFNPKVLGVGFVEGEWGQIGYDRNVDKKIMGNAWDLAFSVLDSLADGIDADIISFVSFNEKSGDIIPVNKLKGFTEFAGLPCAKLPITFNSLDDYINSLSANMRKDLKNKLRSLENIKIVRTRSIRPYLETIYQFYLNLIEKSDLTFGIHRPQFFEHVCDFVPNAEYVLYFIEEKLAAFNLLVLNGNCLVDKYFSMDQTLGRKNNIYFVSWLENVNYCIKNKIPFYHAGQAEEHLKSRLGVEFMPSSIIFKHRNSIIHSLLSRFKQHLTYEPKVALPKARLGKFWSDIS